jgi:hypothetical protein
MTSQHYLQLISNHQLKINFSKRFLEIMNYVFLQFFKNCENKVPKSSTIFTDILKLFQILSKQFKNI